MEASIQNAEEALRRLNQIALVDSVSTQAKWFVEEFLDALVQELSTDRPLLIGDQHYEGPHERQQGERPPG